MCKHLFVALRYLPIGEYLASLWYDCRKFRNLFDTLFLITIILYYYADESTLSSSSRPLVVTWMALMQKHKWSMKIIITRLSLNFNKDR